MATNLFSLSGASLKEVAKRTWAEILEDDVFGRAAQLAYCFFLALFPFLICVIASLSVFGTADRGRALLFQFFANALPPSAFELINRTFDEIIHSSGPLKMSFGIVASLWSASMGMTAVIDTLNAAYKAKETRSLLKQYAVATALTVGIAFLMVLSVAIVVVGNVILKALAPGKIVAGVGSWEDQRLFVVDLDSGQMKQFAEHLAPVLQHQNYFEPANFAPAPGSEATKLFYDADESLIRLDPLTGERRVLLGGARP